MVVLIQKCVFTDNQDGASSPTSPHQDNGVMAQPKKIKGIGFGDIFREGSVKLRVSQRLPSDNEEKKEKVSVVLHMTLSSFPSSKSFLCLYCRTTTNPKKCTLHIKPKYLSIVDVTIKNNVCL